MGKRIPLDLIYRPKGQSHGTASRDVPRKPSAPRQVAKVGLAIHPAPQGKNHQKTDGSDEASAAAILAHKRAVKAAQMRRYRAKVKVK